MFLSLGPLKQLANVVLLVLMLGAVYTHYILNDKFERMAPGLVFSLLLLTRLIIHRQVSQREKRLSKEKTTKSKEKAESEEEETEEVEQQSDEQESPNENEEKQKVSRDKKKDKKNK